MEIILTQDVQGLGKAQDVIKVKDGYARNFLLPRKLALLASQRNLKELAELEKRKTQKLEKEKNKAAELAIRLNNTSVNVAVSTNEEDKMYGSITTRDITRALKEEGFDINEANILLNEPIKNLGIYEVVVQLHPQVQAKIKVWIVKQ